MNLSRFLSKLNVQQLILMHAFYTELMCGFTLAFMHVFLLDPGGKRCECECFPQSRSLPDLSRPDKSQSPQFPYQRSSSAMWPNLFYICCCAEIRRHKHERKSPAACWLAPVYVEGLEVLMVTQQHEYGSLNISPTTKASVFLFHTYTHTHSHKHREVPTHKLCIYLKIFLL